MPIETFSAKIIETAQKTETGAPAARHRAFSQAFEAFAFDAFRDIRAEAKKAGGGPIRVFMATLGKVAMTEEDAIAVTQAWNDLQQQLGERTPGRTAWPATTAWETKGFGKQWGVR